MQLYQWLRWAAPWLAVVAIFLPALTAAAPWVPPQHWSAVELAADVAHLSRPHEDGGSHVNLQDLLRRMQDLRARFVRSPQSGTAVPLAFKLAVLIPVAVLLAGGCAIALAILSWRRLWRLSAVTATVGLIAALYATIVSLVLTNVVRNELAASIARAQHRYNLAALGQMLAGMTGEVVLRPEAALYIMIFAFLAILLLPRPALNPGGQPKAQMHDAQ